MHLLYFNVHFHKHLLFSDPSNGDSNIVKNNDFGIDLPCQITNKEVLSALQRAKTLECKKKIANISCEV